CFHHQFKVRTVIWDFGGQPIPAPLLEDMACLVDTGLPQALSCLLDTIEVEALIARASALLASGELPVDPEGRRIPWPLL
ncbi:MAG TPA: phosphatidylinositol kinase, partial [Acidimicrobiaceae bacterium]|nr:phosphatidylinositol kinase [Acidimicrobiaceae bacterium]